MKLDRYDRHILEVLQQEGRISNQELADRVGLSPSPCLRRVRALEEAGVIEGYRAIINPREVGHSLVVLLHIAMDRHTPERFENFDRAIAKLPQVLDCVLIAGQQADYQLKVIVRDMDEYHDFLLNKITPIEGVAHATSSFMLRQVLTNRPIPLE